jgi:hypothetical protein
LTEAETLAREAYAVGKRARSYSLYALRILNSALQAQGKDREVVALCREELPGLRAAVSPGDYDWAQLLAGFARSLKVLGSPVEADALYNNYFEGLRQAKDSRLADRLAARASELLEEQRFPDAEPLARECLALREKKAPDDWATYNTRSILGGCLLGQKKYVEAEPLLLAGYEGMKMREDKIPASGRPRLKETIQRLVRLYEATDRPNQVAQWKTELTGWYRHEAARRRQAAESGGAEPLNNLAWLLATCEDPTVRDGSGAVVYAGKAVSATHRKNPSFLATLAAAHAEAGQFAEAVSVQKEATGLVQDVLVKKDFAARLKLYESNTPYREHYREP